jgi:hypothetical protein
MMSIILSAFDMFFIKDNIIRVYFGISVYILYIGISASLVIFIRKTKLVKSFNKENVNRLIIENIQWVISLFLVSGMVNEFKYLNSGGIVGNFYKRYLYEIFPYYGIVFLMTLLLYGYILRFPFVSLFNFVSEIIGELIITTFNKFKLNKLFKLNLIKRPKIKLEFKHINDDLYISKSSSNTLSKIENKTPLRRNENDLFIQFEDKIINNEFKIIDKLDGKKENDDDTVVSLLNTAFKHMKLNGIDVLEKTLPGPIVTTYELKLPDSMEVTKLDNDKKLKDLTRRLKVKTIRFKYNQGGTDHVFLEVPNQKPEVVKFEENMKKMIPEMVKQQLPLFIGVNTEGKPRSFDLAKFPHMLVAGSTGSGKTVGIHGMLSSLMTIKNVDHVQLILIDPKLMEFVHYGNSPYLMNVDESDGEYQEIDDIVAPLIHKFRNNIEYTVTEPQTEEGIDLADANEVVHGYDEFQVTDGIVCDMEIVPEILSKLVFTMQVRLLRLKTMRVSNLTEYNEKVIKANGIHTDKNGVEREVKKMPYIVVVIDEFADLMEEYGSQIESLVKRLAQKARAAGIHLILCTQRPSVDVISGVIKANMPVRLSYRLASAIDAKTIGVTDAEKLLGKGDCIINTSEETTRLHGPFIKTSKVSKLSKARLGV